MLHLDLLQRTDSAGLSISSPATEKPIKLVLPVPWSSCSASLGEGVWRLGGGGGGGVGGKKDVRKGRACLHPTSAYPAAETPSFSVAMHAQ